MQEGRVATDLDLNENESVENPITLPEKLGACLLIFATFAIGVYPKVLLDRIIPAVEAMRFLKATLFHGMLVITPLSTLFKIICLIFTILLARGDHSLQNRGEYLNSIRRRSG